MRFIILILLLLSQTAYAENQSAIGSILIDGKNITQGNLVQDAGKSGKITQALENFNKIESNGAFTVNYKSGQAGIEITGDENIVKLVVIKVLNNTLYLGTEKSYSTQSPLIIKVSAPQLSSIRSQGSGEVTVNDISSEQFVINIFGAVNLKAAGKTTNLVIEVNGSGSVNTEALPAQQVTVTTLGSGNVTLNSSESLKAQLTGSGNIIYYGNPQNISKQVLGSGQLIAK